MKVSKAFLRDFGFLANLYKWDENDINEIKQAVREGTGYREFLEQLAAAHRAGYVQDESNNFIRLEQWLPSGLAQYL